MSTSVDTVVDNPSPPKLVQIDHQYARRGSGVRGARYRFGVATVGSQRWSAGTAVEVRRSTKRRRTVSAYRDGDRIVVLIPGRFTVAEEQEWVERMVARVEGNSTRRRSGDASLARRARELSTRYFDGEAVPANVRWVPAMRTRWASCTPADATIRLSRRLQEMPVWVQDYVLVHELAHLIEPGHTPRFWGLVEAYPRTERARGYLDGVSAAAHLPIADDLSDDLAEQPTLDAPDEAAG